MIKAPEGMVLKAYLIDINPFQNGLVRHVLIDEFGMVFVPSSGWHHLQNGDYKLVAFPKPVFKDSRWNWDGWWTFNWQCESWAWCYERKQPDFAPCYVMKEPDGKATIFRS
jgi:hypothetical protein